MATDRTTSRYSAMRWNTPLAADHADSLLHAAGASAARRLLDLGCGWGELLLRALQRAPGDARATGVDTDPDGLQWARDRARERGLADRARFVEADAAGWTEAGDLTLCLGAAHAWPEGVDPLLALRPLVVAGGRLVFGDGFWARDPSPEAVAIFGTGIGSRDALVRRARAAGWSVRTITEAAEVEWDEFEAGFRAGDERWARAHPDDPEAARALTTVAERKVEYETVYRGVLGFAYLVLDG